MFFGRERELATLKEKLLNNRFEAILIYGRRRVGKSKLINEALKGIDALIVNYECKKSLIQDNISGLNDALNETFGVKTSFNDFKSCVDYILSMSKNNKIVLVIDEFPFLLNEKPSISSDLRDLIFEYENNSNVKIILSGSYVDTMKHLNEGDSETFGRFTGIIDLKPFDYYDSSKFYSSYSNEDKILMYSVFGGVAFFNSLIDERISPYDNIKKLLLEPNSILQLEIENTIETETKKIQFLNSAFSFIAEGVSKYSDIKSNLAYKYGGDVNPDYLLKKLIDMDLVEISVPINAQNDKRKRRYQIKDNLILFYYKYIFKNKNKNEKMNVDDFYDYFVKDNLFDRYVPNRFESISKEFLIRRNKAKKIKPPFFDVGRYSFDDAKNGVNREFDIVTEDVNGYISYECKYSNSPIDFSIIHEEEKQTKDLNIKFYNLGFISKKGLKNKNDKYIYYTLDDFYNF